MVLKVFSGTISVDTQPRRDAFQNEL